MWLIGQPISTLPTTKLPSKKEVMSLFFYHKIEEKQNNKEAALSTADAILDVWSKAYIPTRLKKHVVKKVADFFGEWQSLQKTKYLP